MITEKRVEAALDWIEENAHDIAQARADRLSMESSKEPMLALLMKEFDDGETSAVIQKRDALAHPSFQKHLDATKEAVFRDEKYRVLREVKAHIVAVYQTQSANRRRLP
jgi:hypothetical protein